MLEGVYATGSPVRRGRVRLVWAYQRAVLALGHENEYGLFVENDSEQFPLRKDRAKIVRVGCDVPTFRAVSGEGRCTGRDVRALGRTISRNSYDLYFSPSLYTSMPLSSDLPPAVAVRGVVIDLSQDRVMPTLRARRGPVHWLADPRKIPHSQLRTVFQATDSVFQRLHSVDGTALLTRRGLSPSTHGATA